MFRALYPRTIWLIFLSLSAIILSLGVFKYWIPNQEEATFNVKQANDLYSEANKLKQAVNKKNKAVEVTKAAEAAWLPIVAAHTPVQSTEGGGININVNQYKLLLDTKRFRNNIQRSLNNQLKIGGVKVIGPRVDGVSDSDEPNGVLASYYNFPGVPFPVVIHDLGQVTVTGTYDQIMKNVRSWDNFPRYLAVAHGLQLQGTAPTLTGTYNLSMVAYIRYDGVYGPVPGSNSDAGAGGAGGGFGGGGGAPARGAPQGGGSGFRPGAPPSASGVSKG
jgi:hypothetical protein